MALCASVARHSARGASAWLPVMRVFRKGEMLERHPLLWGCCFKVKTNHFEDAFT